MNKPGQARRLQAVFKMHLGRQQGWNPEAHELAKYVAQRQGMQNPQRVNQARVAQVLGHLFL